MREGEAEVRLPVRILVDFGGERSYLVGRNPKPAETRITFRKEGIFWRVTRVEGVK
jgi:hypothetical protein